MTMTTGYNFKSVPQSIDRIPFSRVYIFEVFVFSLSGKIFIRLTGGVDTRSEYMRYVPVILSDAPIMYNFHRDIPTYLVAQNVYGPHFATPV